MTHYLRETGKRRVLFISQSANTGGGVERWLDRVVRHLTGEGWETVVGLVEGPVFHKPDRYLAAHPQDRWVGIRCRTGTPEGRRRAILKVVQSTKPDVVVPLNVVDVLPVIAELKCQGDRVRLLAAVHGHDTGPFLDLRRFRGVVDRAVSVSVLGGRLLTKFCGLPELRVAVAPSGAEPQRNPDDRAGGARPLSLAYVGRLVDREKNVRGLADVLRRLDETGVDFVCDIAGEGVDAALFRTLVSDLLQRGRVRMRGEVSHEELYGSIYPRAAILLITSPAESGPMVAWEAMLHGVVPASYRYRGLAAEGALVDGETALVAPFGDVEGIVRKLRNAVDSNGLLMKLGAKARSVARQRYSWEASLARWSSEFETCLEAAATCGEPAPVTSSPAGRLDRVLGRRLGESVRALARKSSITKDAGDEWPHTLFAGVQDAALDTLLASLDR